MGKTSSWLRNFLTVKKEKKEKYPQNPEERRRRRRRWSFRKSSNPNQSNVGHFPTMKNKASIENLAATRIQAVFRSYLARKALFALRGLVKLQALVRGHLVRKRTAAALRRMQAVMIAQARARAQRLRMAEDSKSSRRSHFFHGRYIAYDNIKMVEVDGGEYKPNWKDRTRSGHFESYYSSTSPQGNSASQSHTYDCPFYPNYMANTDSSKARVRSQSAPRTRLTDSFESQQSRRRASMEGRHRPWPVRTMQRSPSQVGCGSIKLYRASASRKDSVSGSTSTILTTTDYFKSLAS